MEAARNSDNGEVTSGRHALPNSLGLHAEVLLTSVFGPYVLWKVRREDRRLAAGWTYEPPTFYEVNDAVPTGDRPEASRCRYVTPAFVSPEGGGETNEGQTHALARRARMIAASDPQEEVRTSGI